MQAVGFMPMADRSEEGKVSPHAGGEPAFKANSLIFVKFQEENLSHVMHYHFSR